MNNITKFLRGEVIVRVRKNQIGKLKGILFDSYIFIDDDEEIVIYDEINYFIIKNSKGTNIKWCYRVKPSYNYEIIDFDKIIEEL